MKRILKRILIIAMAVVCACSIQLTVSAAPGIGEGLGGMFEDIIKDVLTSLNPNNTTTTETTNTTATTENPNNTTGPTATTDPINNSGTGTIPSSTGTTQNNPQNNYQPNTMPTQLTTAEPAGDEEGSSFSYESSLSDLLEEDSAAIIVQTPTENYTIGGLVVNNGGSQDGMKWQQIVLIAAAVLFVILAALIVALLVQRGKRPGDDSYDGISIDSDPDFDAPSGPVPVEVVTPERIAELLGTAAAEKRSSGASLDGFSSDDSAAAIKAAALMGQLGSYSDPLIRKYTEEPVRISPISQMSVDGVSASEILEATDSMLKDITGNERYASDIRGLDIPDSDLDAMLSDTKTKTCPECNAPVPSGDVFCHSCGAYVG